MRTFDDRAGLRAIWPPRALQASVTPVLSLTNTPTHQESSSPPCTPPHSSLQALPAGLIIPTKFTTQPAPTAAAMQRCLALVAVFSVLLSVPAAQAGRALQQDALSNSNGCLGTIPKCVGWRAPVGCSLSLLLLNSLLTHNLPSLLLPSSCQLLHTQV